MENHHECHHHHHYHGGWGVFRVVGIVLGGMMLAVVLGFFFGWVIEHLWNWLMPSVFGLRPITYWQGFGLFVLSKLLFGAFGHHPGHRGRNRHKRHGRDCGSDGDDWNDEMWKVRGSHKNWKYYGQYWKDEGKAAFEAYLDRMEEKKL
jgi:hypothetical protein